MIKVYLRLAHHYIQNCIKKNKYSWKKGLVKNTDIKLNKVYEKDCINVFNPYQMMYILWSGFH